MTIMEYKFDIFLSYSRKDFDSVVGLKNMLEDQVPGIKIWFDINGIESGDEFQDRIIDAINNSRIFIFALTKNSLASPWTRKEITFAKSKGIKIIPIIMKGEKMDDWFIFNFGGIDCIELDNDIHVNKLISNAKQWCGIDTPKSQQVFSFADDSEIMTPTKDVKSTGHPKSKQPFTLKVDDVFPVEGLGIMVCGYVESGTLELGMMTAIYRNNSVVAYAKVIGIETFRELVAFCEYGDIPGIILKGIKKNFIHKDDVLKRADNL